MVAQVGMASRGARRGGGASSCMRGEVTEVHQAREKLKSRSPCAWGGQVSEGV